MSEKAMRQKFVKALKSIHAVSVENPVGPGTPDVNYVGGWIELKWMARWPKIPADKPVLIPHYTPQQRIWAQRRTRAGGSVWLLLQVGQEFLLFDGAWAADNLGKQPRQTLLNGCWAYWDKGYDVEELKRAITQSS